MLCFTPKKKKIGESVDRKSQVYIQILFCEKSELYELPDGDLFSSSSALIRHSASHSQRSKEPFMRARTSCSPFVFLMVVSRWNLFRRGVRRVRSRKRVNSVTEWSDSEWRLPRAFPFITRGHARVNMFTFNCNRHETPRNNDGISSENK